MSKYSRKRDQNGLLLTKTALIVGSIMTASTIGMLTGASALSASTPEKGSGSSNFCVTSTWVDRPDIKTYRGSCSTDEIEPEIPEDDPVIEIPEEEPIIEIPEDEPVVTADPIIATYTCDIATIEVTQSMEDHSKANEDLKAAGKSAEMTEYKDAGWKIMIDLAKSSTPTVKVSGVAFTTNGDNKVSDSNTIVNHNGPAMFLQQPNSCHSYYYLNGEISSHNGPALIEDYKNELGVMHHYFVDGKRYREDSKPQIVHYKDGVKTSDRWVNEDGKNHRTEGPAEINYDESGKTTIKTYAIDNVIYGNNIGEIANGGQDAWIAAGGDLLGWPL